MNNKLTHLYPSQTQQQGQTVIAKVIDTQNGEALSVDIAGEQLNVVGHFAEVSILKTADRVAVMQTEEGVIVMSRLRNPGETPCPLVLDQNGRLEIEAAGGICLKTGESRIEITTDGRIWVDGREIYSISEGRMRLQGSTIELN